MIIINFWIEIEIIITETGFSLYLLVLCLIAKLVYFWLNPLFQCHLIEQDVILYLLLSFALNLPVKNSITDWQAKVTIGIWQMTEIRSFSSKDRFFFEKFLRALLYFRVKFLNWFFFRSLSKTLKIIYRVNKYFRGWTIFNY